MVRHPAAPCHAPGAALFVDLEITQDREKRRSGSDHRTPNEFNAEARA